MKHGTRGVVLAGASALALFVIVNCGEVASNLESGARCSLNSDCKAPLVCGFERCRAQCKTSRDCNGKLCVRSETNGQSSNVCQLDDEVECTHNSSCPGTQLCGPDHHCRDVCITDKDCITDLLCVSRVCAKSEELVNGQLPQRSSPDAGASCTYATDCPGDLVCLYGRCDVECLADKDCRIGWKCKPQSAGGDGRCYPNKTGSGIDASADAPEDSGGADTGNSEAGSRDAASDASDAGDGGASTRIVALAAGSIRSCALFLSGALKCWGDNTQGELGLGDTITRGNNPSQMGDALPYVALGTGRTAKFVSSKYSHTCAILDNDKVKCWGQNSVGQLGLGDTKTRGGSPGEMGDNLPYVDLGAGRTAKAITTGRDNTCVILDNDKVKCWGGNLGGGLGLGDTTVRGDGPGEMGDNLPYVDLGAGRTPKALASTMLTNCALLDNDKVKCWGDNFLGQLGLGDTAPRGASPGTMGDNLPYVDLGTGRTVKQMAGYERLTCAILDNAKIKCWGRNDSGQLGLGDLNNRGDAPGEMGDALPYVDLGTGRTALSVTVGLGGGCAILDTGKAKCWGNSASGELGLGDMITRGDAPGEMGDALPFLDLGTGRTVKSFISGAQHRCALLDSDLVKCWGQNSSAQLGLGDTNPRGTGPNQMGDNLPYIKLVGP